MTTFTILLVFCIPLAKQVDSPTFKQLRYGTMCVRQGFSFQLCFPKQPISVMPCGMSSIIFFSLRVLFLVEPDFLNLCLAYKIVGPSWKEKVKMYR